MKSSDSERRIGHGMAACMIVVLVFMVTGCDLFCPPVITPLVEMMDIPGGSFVMGTQSGGSDDERPVHTVTLSGFRMGKYEVTQEQYLTVMGDNPSWFSGPTKPVDQVTWYEAVEFCNRLSDREELQKVYTITDRVPLNGYPITSATVDMDMTRNGYRLPTEAEWEYAAKGGDESPGNHEYAGSNDVNAVGWYDNNSERTTHAVGQKTPNGLGLYDMSGNVWEWCSDWYASYGSAAQTNPAGPSSGTGRVLRGGAWNNEAARLRVAHRFKNDPSYRYSRYGFRIVRSRF